MREKTIYEKIAEKYNTTPEEVRREMQIAIDAGFDNPDPAVQEEWKKMTLKGDRPDVYKRQSWYRRQRIKDLNRHWALRKSR